MSGLLQEPRDRGGLIRPVFLLSNDKPGTNFVAPLDGAEMVLAWLDLMNSKSETDSSTYVIYKYKQLQAIHVEQRT